MLEINRTRKQHQGDVHKVLHMLLYAACAGVLQLRITCLGVLFNEASLFQSAYLNRGFLKLQSGDLGLSGELKGGRGKGRWLNGAEFRC